jgi:hypothetical protein
MTRRWDRTNQRKHTLRPQFCAPGVEVYVSNIGLDEQNPLWQVVMHNPATGKRTRLMHATTDLHRVGKVFRSLTAAKRRAEDIAYAEHWLRRVGALPSLGDV